MEIKKHDDSFPVSPQLLLFDIEAVRQAGFRSAIDHRPDGEGNDLPAFESITAAARKVGIEVRYQPIKVVGPTDSNVSEFDTLRIDLPGPVLAFCRSGTRSASVWALSTARHSDAGTVLSAARAAGYDLTALEPRFCQGRAPSTNVTASAGAGSDTSTTRGSREHDIVVVGAGAAGIAVAASLLARNDSLDIALIEPANSHYCQPGWTMVGAGVSEPAETARSMDGLIPACATGRSLSEWSDKNAVGVLQ